MISRRRILILPAALMLAPPAYAASQAQAVQWTDGGIKPCQQTMEWCIRNFPDVTEGEREYFLAEWDTYRGVNYDPTHPLVSTIKEGDEFLYQFFGNGTLVRNVVARPDSWKRGLSRLTITLRRVYPDGTFVEVSKPQVCSNGSYRRGKLGEVHCIPSDVRARKVDIRQHLQVRG